MRATSKTTDPGYTLFCDEPDFDPADPPRPGFNRHATAHRVDPVSYGPEDSIVAVMLMVSSLREIEASGW